MLLGITFVRIIPPKLHFIIRHFKCWAFFDIIFVIPIILEVLALKLRQFQLPDLIVKIGELKVGAIGLHSYFRLYVILFSSLHLLLRSKCSMPIIMARSSFVPKVHGMPWMVYKTMSRLLQCLMAKWHSSDIILTVTIPVNSNSGVMSQVIESAAVIGSYFMTYSNLKQSIRITNLSLAWKHYLNFVSTLSSTDLNILLNLCLDRFDLEEKHKSSKEH